jgi:small GTP-binding protein
VWPGEAHDLLSASDNRVGIILNISPGCESMRIRRMRLKICLVGDRGVGKTSLIQRYVAGKFNPAERGTLGAHLYPVDVEVPLGERELVKASIAFFDFMGEHAMRENFRDAIFYGAHGALAVCDLAKPNTLYSLSDWMQAFSSVAGAVPMSVVLNKADLASGIAIGMEEMRWLREHFPSAPSFVTSALSGQGVAEAFDGIIGRAVDSLMETRRKVQANQLLRHRILLAVARRQSQGISKREIIEAFKTVDPKVVMDELNNLMALELIQQEEYARETPMSAESIPITFHFTITPAGVKAAEEPGGEDLIVDDIS